MHLLQSLNNEQKKLDHEAAHQMIPDSLDESDLSHVLSDDNSLCNPKYLSHMFDSEVEEELERELVRIAIEKEKEEQDEEEKRSENEENIGNVSKI